MTNITIDSTAFDAKLTQLQQKMAHTQPVMSSIADLITENVRLTFRDLNSPYGVPWKTLSFVTKFNRAKRIAGGVYIKSGKRTKAKFLQTYLSADPLNDTGILRNSISFNASDIAAEIGTNAKQAAMMN